MIFKIERSDDLIKVLCGVYAFAMLFTFMTSFMFCYPFSFPDELNQLGDFFAGAFAPLAFGYFYLGYNEQKREIARLSQESVIDKKIVLNELSYPQINNKLNDLRNSVGDFSFYYGGNEAVIRGQILEIPKISNYLRGQIEAQRQYFEIYIDNILNNFEEIITMQKMILFSHGFDYFRVLFEGDLDKIIQESLKPYDDSAKFLNVCKEFCLLYEEKIGEYKNHMDEIHERKIEIEFLESYKKSKKTIYSL